MQSVVLFHFLGKLFKLVHSTTFLKWYCEYQIQYLLKIIQIQFLTRSFIRNMLVEISYGKNRIPFIVYCLISALNSKDFNFFFLKIFSQLSPVQSSRICKFIFKHKRKTGFFSMGYLISYNHYYFVTFLRPILI
jgi:hypothetical protein